MALSFRPLVAICGTTGVGKSKLAIELALHINNSNAKYPWRCAKVINADSMQVYNGLDVITNKVPEQERHGIPHLLMDFKRPGEQYVVGEWVQDAIKLIDEMHENNELPIVVGGTSYWMQHLIFPNRLVSKQPSLYPSSPAWSEELKASISSLSPELLSLFENLPVEAPSAKLDPDHAFKLHSILSILDSSVSQRWHWKDTRKVLRNLKIIKESGKRPSEILLEQSTTHTDIKTRFHTVCFWLYAESAELGGRLDARVDDMISQGLIDEVRRLRQLANAKASDPLETHRTISVMDYTLGIYQSIGYKEFCTYLDAPSDSSFKEAQERMKISTRQYAKRQISWIRNKLIPAVEEANLGGDDLPFYLLDATVLGDDWSRNVQMPATEILAAFLVRDGSPLPHPKSLSVSASKMLSTERKDIKPTSVLEVRKRQVCSICTVQEDRPVMIEEGSEWELHQKSRAHRRLAGRVARQKREFCTLQSESKERSGR
ncbi:IPP transferase-domain-containing protein [Gymnopilus junonius]|uniref:tRNA dimethylallyltransferase n=1 Tax=Gymnopilus junonius TaxID=109634 RepID=A0A9P5TPU4_GYMJU|nr:IPP transferase-domain-containing protein [Gymnopilus junonius]